MTGWYTHLPWTTFASVGTSGIRAARSRASCASTVAACAGAYCGTIWPLLFSPYIQGDISLKVCGFESTDVVP